MGTAINIDQSRLRSNSKFRPVAWNDIRQPGVPVIGWGIEEKIEGARRYVPRGFEGKIVPFATREEALDVCKMLADASAKKGCK